MKLNSAVGLALLSLPLHTLALPSGISESPSFYARSVLEKRANNPVVGLTDGVNGAQRPVRQELSTFVQNSDRLSLYLIALTSMGKKSYSDPNSYYAISGIHGRPYVGWNGEANTGASGTGYCTHASILFPTWHRPYLALYEQAIHAEMQNQVNLFPAAQQARWQNALNGFRIPYWDWASVNQGQMPSILTTPTWTVTQTSGAQASIANPLYSYTFPTLSRTDFPDSPFYLWKNTLRYPTSQQSNAVSQMSKVNTQLAQSYSSQKQRVYNLFFTTQYNNYVAVSNKASSARAPDSLESIHDTIHGLTGNGGHMGYIDYSAFDPIFYLHHANIDRIFAMWQAVYPNSWITTGQTNTAGTYGVPPNTVETATTGLTPFRNSAGALHTSNSIRSTAAFGYSYPEIPDWNYQGNPSGLTTYVKQQVQNLYGTTTQQVASGSQKRDLTGDNSTATAIDNSVVDNKYYDWRVDIHTNKMVLGGSYFVHVFLGQPNADPASWSAQPELVGDYVVFANKLTGRPSRGNVCGKKDNQVSGSVFLTQALLNKIATVGSLNPDDVVKYVKKNINWRISLMDDSGVAVSDVCDLKISVSAAQVTLPPKDQADAFPVFGDYVPYANITDGKVGGGVPIPALSS